MHGASMTKSRNIRRTGISMLNIVDVERRFLRSCKTLRAVPDRERRFQRVESCWPEYVLEAAEAYGYTEAQMPRFRPTPFDVSDMLTALAWARPLQENEFRMTWWRSFDLSFGQIGRRIGKSDETARRYYRDVMVKLWAQANAQHLAPAA
jgi:hypothetical protein